MATINGIVTIGDTEIPGQADVLLLNAAGTEVVASTTSDAATGAYAFEGLPGGTTYRVLVLGGGVYRSRAFGPVTPFDPAQQDPHWANVVALLHFDDVQDPWEDQTGKAWSSSGAAQFSTENYKFPIGSLYLTGGNSGNIATPYSDGFDFGGGDFTVEVFVQYLGLGSNQYSGIISQDQIKGTRGWLLLVDPDNGGGFTFAAWRGRTSYLAVDPTPAPVDERFHHVAAVRAGEKLSLYVDGVEVSSVAITGYIGNPEGPCVVGRLGSTSGYTNNTAFNGYIDELRITKGVARYTEDFDPPTAPFPNF